MNQLRLLVSQPESELSRESLLIPCPFQYALADTERDPRGQASLVGSSPSRYPFTRLEASAQLAET